MSKRFIDVVDETADVLQDAAEAFQLRRAELLGQLEEAKDAFADAIFAAERVAVEHGIIPDEEWTDEEGEPFLPFVLTEVVAEEIPDMGTLFRNRVEHVGRHDRDGA